MLTATTEQTSYLTQVCNAGLLNNSNSILVNYWRLCIVLPIPQFCPLKLLPLYCYAFVSLLCICRQYIQLGVNIIIYRQSSGLHADFAGPLQWTSPLRLTEVR